MRKEAPTTPYGMIAEFEDAEELVVAASRAREAGFRKLDAYSPFPVHGLAEAIGFHDNKVPWMIFWGGVLGAAIGFGLQCWINVIEYPLNVGGRPLVPWISWFPVTFEVTVLSAAFFAVFGACIGMNGLPRPHHPLFDAKNFERATQDRFFLVVESEDPKFEEAPEFLRSLGAVEVSEVAR